jgi:hypothetical protein
VQPLGQGLPAGQFDDLKALDGGNRGVSPRVFLPAVGVCADDAFGLIPMVGPPNRGLFALELLGHGSSPVACARAKTIRVRRTWNHGRLWLRAICKRSVSSAERMRNRIGFRPRMAGCLQVEEGGRVEYEFRKPEEALQNQKLHAE